MTYSCSSLLLASIGFTYLASKINLISAFHLVSVFSAASMQNIGDPCNDLHLIWTSSRVAPKSSKSHSLYFSLSCRASTVAAVTAICYLVVCLPGSMLYISVSWLFYIGFGGCALVFHFVVPVGVVSVGFLVFMRWCSALVA